MEAVVWVVGGILALNVVTVGALWTFAALRRYAAERRRRRLEARWDVRRLPPAAPRPHRLRQVTGLAVSATLVLTLVALGDGRAGRVIGSALGAVVPGLSSDDEEHPDRVAVERADARRSAAVGRPASPSIETGGPPGSPSYAGGGTSDGPAAPATVAALPRSSSAILLSWAQVPGATAYGIERWEAEAAEWLAIAETPVDVTIYTDEGLDPGTTYYYRVVALGEAGAAEPSGVTAATTPPAPPAQTILTATTSSPVAIDLSWVDAADETGYRLERSADGATGWITIATTGQDVTSYTDTGLTPGTTYHYRVVVANAGGESAPSAVMSATTAPEPAAPDVTSSASPG